MTLREQSATHRIKVTEVKNSDEETKEELAKLFKEHPELLCWKDRNTAEWIMSDAGFRPSKDNPPTDNVMAAMQLTCEIVLGKWLAKPVIFSCELVPNDYQAELFLPDEDRTDVQEVV